MWIKGCKQHLSILKRPSSLSNIIISLFICEFMYVATYIYRSSSSILTARHQVWTTHIIICHSPKAGRPWSNITTNLLFCTDTGRARDMGARGGDRQGTSFSVPRSLYWRSSRDLIHVMPCITILKLNFIHKVNLNTWWLNSVRPEVHKLVRIIEYNWYISYVLV